MEGGCEKERRKGQRDINREGEMRKRWKDEKGRKEILEHIYNPCVSSLAGTPGKFSHTAELLCCSDLMNIHEHAEREGGRLDHGSILMCYELTDKKRLLH